MFPSIWIYRPHLLGFRVRGACQVYMSDLRIRVSLLLLFPPVSRRIFSRLIQPEATY